MDVEPEADMTEEGEEPASYNVPDDHRQRMTTFSEDDYETYEVDPLAEERTTCR